ncbi:MAG: glycosyltransferase family 2 protein [Bacteroidota bacterium]
MINPLVSILIPFKDTAMYISECIRSILDQEYKNWEILAVNDHSKDHSLDIINNFAQDDARIHVLDNTGDGIIDALKLAYAYSRGDYITRMDSDDVMESNKLQVLVNALLTRGKGHVAIGQVRYFSDKGISNGYARYEDWLNQLTKLGANYSEIYKECVIPSPCWMLHRKDLELCGAFAHDRYPEDYDLTFRLYEKDIQCIPCNEILHQWRDYDSRTSRTSEHYAQNYFLDIKLHYFLKLDHEADRSLAIWGAGYKGKAVAKGLLEKGVHFYWLCDNPKKIGKHIYGKELVHYDQLSQLKNSQSIVTVANAEAQHMIKSYFSHLGKKNMKDYFFFC